MSLFLLTYERRNGASKQPDIERFEDADLAMQRFVEAERFHREHPDGRGVVLLIADDEETLRHTHAHYFKTTEEILAPYRVTGP